MKKKIHLVCNAHLDPVWCWHWEDGLAETLSTYRVAADFADKHPAFVFNHNEAVLYHWVEQHEPTLFRRIQRLVKSGQWHVAGGAWLQPDVNNPNGESHIRQFLVGLNYFREKFGVRPTTAYNFDPFGHPEGFPQILNGCGMDSYIFCRPDYGTYDLPLGAFQWRDRSGSTVITRRSDDHYLTNGNVRGKLDEFLVHFADEPETMILWGIGNHGGGVSKAEYSDLQRYMKEHPEYEWIESTPEAFFTSTKRRSPSLPVVKGEIQNSFPGCYTSMSRVKRGHRQAESLMAATERLCALAWWNGDAPYPSADLATAWKDIMFTEFHDILPGSCIPDAEKDSMLLIGHCLEKLRRTRLSSLIPVLAGDKPAKDREVPIYIVNPHGHRYRGPVEFEYHVANQLFLTPDIALKRNGRQVPFQRIKAQNNLDSDWRVRLLVQVDLKPFEIQRYDASYKPAKARFRPRLPAATAGALSLRAPGVSIRINPRTGLVDSVRVPGVTRSLVRKKAFQPILFKDMDHSWTCGDPDQMKGPGAWSTAPAWRKPTARFRLATAAEAKRISPEPDVKWAGGTTKPVRVIEDGPIQRVVEVLFVYETTAIVRHYVFGKKDGHFEIRDRVLNNIKDTMLKLEVPLGFDPVESVSETPYSAVKRAPTSRYEERSNQRWVAVRGKGVCLTTINNGSFAHNLTKRSLCLNVLRTPAYASFGVPAGSPFSDKRFLPRHDQGEHEVSFQFMFSRSFRERTVTQAAAALNVPPYYQVYFPAKEQTSRSSLLKTQPITVSADNVQIVAVKKSEHGNALVLRLQELSGRDTDVQLRFAGSRGTIRTSVKAYGLQTLKITRKSNKVTGKETNLVEGA